MTESAGVPGSEEERLLQKFEQISKNFGKVAQGLVLCGENVKMESKKVRELISSD